MERRPSVAVIKLHGRCDRYDMLSVQKIITNNKCVYYENNNKRWVEFFQTFVNFVFAVRANSE